LEYFAKLFTKADGTEAPYRYEIVIFALHPSWLSLTFTIPAASLATTHRK
jgi:hypothetical protein